MTYQNELETALEAVREASLLCRSVQSSLDRGAMEKRDRSPVTVADYGSQALICRKLGEKFPGDPIMAEEDAKALREPENHAVLNRMVAEVRKVVPDAGPEEVTSWIDRGNAATYSRRFWTLDPIDGTKGFLRSEQYAIALALIVEGEPVVAALACPNLEVSGTVGNVFGAVAGQGAFREPIEGEPDRTAVSVSEIADPSRARFCESVESAHTSHSEAVALAEELGIRREPYRLDSQAKYAVVAAGEAEIYLRLTRHTGYVENIWDHAAGALVVEEAGGKLTDLNGERLDFSRGPRLEKNVGIVASNGRFHDRILEVLARIQSNPIEQQR